MAKIDQDILTALREMLGELGSCFVATVTDNGKGTDTLTVKDLDGTLYNNVRKRAAEDGRKGLVVTPVKGSTIVAGRLGVSDQLVVLLCSEIEEVTFTLDDHLVKVDKDGLSINMSSGKFEIKNDQENLKALINDLVTEITKLTVTTGTGPSGTPINITAFQEIAQRVPKLFK